jgi:hypothetical protein
MSQRGNQSLEHGRVTRHFEDVIGRIRARFRQLGHPGA